MLEQVAKNAVDPKSLETFQDRSDGFLDSLI